MLYVQFVAENNCLKNCNKGTTHMHEGGGGQQGVIIDHTLIIVLLFP